MKHVSSADIRQTYLDFFEKHQHTIVSSSSLVPANDPTLLFTNAGMVPFKDTFLGLESRPYTRATSSQKCLRVSGKHNDLEEVGPSPRHHTFFEMLGNFSFGDYFKAEAIQLAWKLLTEEFQLPVERLWFTVFEGNDQVSADEEAIQLWQHVGAPSDRILRFGESENFWRMGDTGPCGPCSEIHYYRGDDLTKQQAIGVNSEDPDYMEIWNLVFMQYDSDTQGKLTPLPRPSIDTGMGFERIVSVLQDVKNNYDTDIFTPIIHKTIELLGRDEAHYREHFAPYRAVADHSRSMAFLIADGVLPGKNGRAYVLRRILRRAAYQGRTIGFERPFLADVVATVIEQMGTFYPELQQRRDFILETVDIEERQFLRTLSSGLTRLHSIIDQVTANKENTVSGEDAFRLQDTFGFPLDLTQKIALERNLTVDVAGFETAMEEQRVQSRDVSHFKQNTSVEIWSNQDLPPTSFVGYTQEKSESRVLALVVGDALVKTASAGQEVQIVLDETPFYAESGGQIGDSGTLISETGQVRVNDTQRPIPGVVVHYGAVKQGEVAIDTEVTAQVDSDRRQSIMRSHTATHLLHRALRDVLGEHAAQSGSLVAPDRLRFDFSHMRSVSPEQIQELERRINAWIRSDTAVMWENTNYQDAIDHGAIALFGEKYTDEVRMVTVGCTASDAASSSPYQQCSRELCGGTHVARTGEIGYFRIIGESSVAAGVRRIEALSGLESETWVDTQTTTLQDIALRLSVTPSQALERIDSLLAELKSQQQQINAFQGQQMRGSLDTLLTNTKQVNNVTYLAARVDVPDAAKLREMGDWLRDKVSSGVIVLGTVLKEKPQLMVVVTRDLLEQGYHAGNIVKSLAPIMGGGGGGRPDMAQAGGRDVSKLDEALDQVENVLVEQGTA
ncbi:MAG: alanine--tRNA ligase [Chloroflexota bacterium]